MNDIRKADVAVAAAVAGDRAKWAEVDDAIDAIEREARRMRMLNRALLGVLIGLVMLGWSATAMGWWGGIDAAWVLLGAVLFTAILPVGGKRVSEAQDRARRLLARAREDPRPDFEFPDPTPGVPVWRERDDGRVDVIAPQLGDPSEAVDVERWDVEVGDRIEGDQSIVEVVYDWWALEFATPFDGVVEEIHFLAGEVAPIGAALCTIRREQGG